MQKTAVYLYICIHFYFLKEVESIYYLFNDKKAIKMENKNETI